MLLPASAPACPPQAAVGVVKGASNPTQSDPGPPLPPQGRHSLVIEQLTIPHLVILLI